MCDHHQMLFDPKFWVRVRTGHDRLHEGHRFAAACHRSERDRKISDKAHCLQLASHRVHQTGLKSEPASEQCAVRRTVPASAPGIPVGPDDRCPPEHDSAHDYTADEPHDLPSWRTAEWRWEARVEASASAQAPGDSMKVSRQPQTTCGKSAAQWISEKYAAHSAAKPRRLSPARLVQRFRSRTARSRQSCAYAAGAPSAWCCSSGRPTAGGFRGACCASLHKVRVR